MLTQEDEPDQHRYGPLPGGGCGAVVLAAHGAGATGGRGRPGAQDDRGGGNVILESNSILEFCSRICTWWCWIFPRKISNRRACDFWIGPTRSSSSIRHQCADVGRGLAAAVGQQEAVRGEAALLRDERAPEFVKSARLFAPAPECAALQFFRGLLNDARRAPHLTFEAECSGPERATGRRSSSNSSGMR